MSSKREGAIDTATQVIANSLSSLFILTYFAAHPYCSGSVNSTFYSQWDSRMSVSFQAE